MKTMKTTFATTKYFLLALLVTFSFSCSPEDGEDGAVGPQGPAGPAGTDGNANVQTLTFDATTFSGTIDTVAVPELTQSVLDNDAVLTYLTDDGNFWVPVPCPFDTYQFDFSVQVTFSVGNIEFDYGDASGTNFSISAGDLQELKVIIIASNAGSKTSNVMQQTKTELEAAGVNINDYYAVCDYYNIAY